jgi:short-subunit dehydrogenase
MPAARTQPAQIDRPVVWVMGASRGIGAEIALQFASVGCMVCCSSRSREHLQVLKKRITWSGGDAEIFPCDITRRDSINKTSSLIYRRYRKIDVLINNAGITVFKDFLHTTVEQFDDIINTNLRGPILCTKSVLPDMVKRRSGWIINVLSNAALKAFEGSAVYTATKAGLLGFSRVLREETRKSNIKVISIIPGATETGMWSLKDRKRYRHRMMNAKSVAEAILSIYLMPPDVVADEILLRPMFGDID